MTGGLELLIALAFLLAARGAVSVLLTTATRGEKIFWLSVLAVPLAGFLSWYVFGPRGESLVRRAV